MKKTLLTLTMALLVTGVSTASAAMSTYDVGTEVGVGNTALTTDGWTGAADMSVWKVGTFAGVGEYLRNEGGDSTISRQNDAGFSYTIDSNTTSFTLETHGRFGVNAYFVIGLVDSSGGVLVGMGADWYQNPNKCLIFEGSRIFEPGTSYPDAVDSVHTMKLDVDLLANGGNGSADLYFDGGLIIDDQALTLPDMTTASGLSFRTGSRYLGPGEITLTTTQIPEPATLSLLALGAIAMLRRKRK